MSSPPDSLPPLPMPALITRLGLIAAIVLGLAVAFAFAGGWFSPDRLKPSKFPDAFERVDGVHPGYRRNHAKGVCAAGSFESNGKGAKLSKAAVFTTGRVPLVGRFSLGGGMPAVTDSPGDVRGLGIQFSTADGQTWRTAMINLPVFPMATPQAFYDRLVASAPDPVTGKPDPKKMEAFAAANPETVAAINIIKQQPPASGFSSTTFHGLNAFRFTSADGTVSAVRWELVPAVIEKAKSASQPADPNYLFDGLIDDIHHAPAKWELILIVAHPGDPTKDATLPWPADRERIDAGTITFDKIESDDTSATAALNFDPLVLPDGIAPSDDPLLSARSAVYSQSYTRRAGEQKDKAPAAITPRAVDGGTH